MTTLTIDPAAMTALLDERHLVVAGGGRRNRRSVATELRTRLETLEAAEVIDINGSSVAGLRGFCDQLAAALPPRRLAPHTETDVIETLRHWPGSARRRYFVWRDADVLLDADGPLFGRLAGALLAVAAELEHVSPDVLILQRAVFLGPERLADYAAEPCGRLRAWPIDPGPDGFGLVAALVKRPLVMTVRLDGAPEPLHSPS
ncbi:MAG: hypothetical protein GY715_15490 [Planctomycetes bacterium]|nr:hypothetical protein [Planctomycetota bacterium]